MTESPGLRILTISHFYEDHGGGIERVAGHLARQFALQGYDSIWAASSADEPPESGVQAVPLRCANPIERLTGLPMPIPGLGAIRRLAREVRSSDAVVVHDALYVTSILALLIAKANGKRVILIQHIAGIPFSSRVLRLVMKMANWIVTRPMLWAADVRVFISDTVRHELLGTPARHSYELLFNGVDGGIFHPGRREASQSYESNGTAPRKILFVGRYVEKKGLTILRALASARPDLTLLLAGSGPMRPAEWGLNNVHDLGVKGPQALADLYRTSDVLLLPSVGEGYPLVIQEAMACGLPVVCGEPTNRADPEMASWIRGVPIDLADPEGSASRCAAALDTQAASYTERIKMAELVLQRYDWQTMAQRLLALARRPKATVLT